MVLAVCGSLLDAGSRTLLAHLPDPAGNRRRRWCYGCGAAHRWEPHLVKVVGDYADRLTDVDGRLCLSGLQPAAPDGSIHRKRRRTGAGVRDGPPVAGESAQAACLAAQAWLVERHGA
jgi:sulfate permease, SulP family